MSEPANFNGQRPIIDPDDAVMFLIDHQSGLFQVVKDMDVEVLRRNVNVLAKAADLADIPVITTASVPQGPNGPIIPDIKEQARRTKYVPRAGEINAWDSEDVANAVRETGRKTLIIAGTMTSVCMAFPALSAIQEGYKVFCVVDASGTYSKMAQEITMARIQQAGAVPIDTVAVISEIQKTWKRRDAQKWAELFAMAIPNYKLLIESHEKAAEVAKSGEKSDAEK